MRKGGGGMEEIEGGGHSRVVAEWRDVVLPQRLQ